MPLKKGRSKKVMEHNFHELRHGKQYARAARKHGKTVARKQMVAIVLKTKRSARRRATGRR